MRVKKRFYWHQMAIALVALAWTGCATMNEVTPFDLASHRDGSARGPASPSQFATPNRSDAAPAHGYQAQFVSAPTARPQRRYSVPSCTSGYG